MEVIGHIARPYPSEYRSKYTTSIKYIFFHMFRWWCASEGGARVSRKGRAPNMQRWTSRNDLNTPADTIYIFLERFRKAKHDSGFKGLANG